MSANRKTSREITRLYNAAKTANPALVPVFDVSTIGTDRKLKFVGTIDLDGDIYVPASDNGKVKTFADVDSFVSFAAKCCENGDGVYDVKISTGAILASKVPADMKTWAAAQVTRLAQVKTGQNATIAGIDQQLSLMVGWETGNQAQKAKKLETQQQRAAVVEDIAAIDAEVVRLTAIVNS